MKKLLQLIIKRISCRHFDGLIFSCTILIMFHILVHASNLISDPDFFFLINSYNMMLC